MNEEQILNYIEDDDKLSHEWFIYQGTEDGTIFDFYAEFIRNDLEDQYLALAINNGIYYSEAVDLIDSEEYWVLTDDEADEKAELEAQYFLENALSEVPDYLHRYFDEDKYICEQIQDRGYLLNPTTDLRIQSHWTMVQYFTFIEGINMQLDTLYKQGKTAIQVCNISAIGDTVIVEFGQLNGKMQSKATVCTAKNVGRANATTPEQQAILEAQAKHVDKVKSGYSTDISAPVTVQLPQKVKSYLDNKHLVKFPAFTTPKLNGVNGTYWLNDGKLLLTSRGGEYYPLIPHLEEQIKQAMDFLNTDCLNGELYIHGEHLQDIQSAVKKPNKLSPKLQFHIFELPTVSEPYSVKSTLFGQLNTTLSLSHVIGITPILVESHEDATHWYDMHIASGFEGSVIYNSDATYQFNVRSSSVLKYKGTLDLEVKLLSYNVDKNGHPVFNAIYNGKEFKVKSKGTDKERKDIIANFESQYKDKYYTIEYECFSKDGTPLKPVGICLRDCDSAGEPLI